MSAQGNDILVAVRDIGGGLVLTGSITVEDIKNYIGSQSLFYGNKHTITTGETLTVTSLHEYYLNTRMTLSNNSTFVVEPTARLVTNRLLENNGTLINSGTVINL